MTSFIPHDRLSSPTPSASILVVDDLETSRYLTGSWLRRNGYRVTEATTGGQALALVGDEDFDLVVLDVHLPDMSGFDVCERIKDDPRTAATPVIHVSATAVEAEDRALGLSRGADAYLVEPVDPAELVATVEAALRYYRARSVAERLARRLTLLTEATMAVNTATTFDGLLAAAADGAATILNSSATVLTITSEGRLRAATASGAGGPTTLRTLTPGLLERVTSSALGEGKGAVTVVGELGWRPGGSSTVFLARTKGSRPPLGIAVDTAAADSDEDRNLLVQLGQATALACEGLRAFSEEHTLALTLQRSLLPSTLPDRPELPMAVRYVPASFNAEIGGDFYEVTELDGRLLIAVGDVTGHSIEAATVMGEVRHALRAYAVEGHDPVTILDRLDAMIQRFHPRGLTTLCLLLVDLATGETEVANAGHIPPLVADQDGARYLDVHGPLLGIDLTHPAATRFTIPPGTLVLLVTDGLVERREHSIDDGMEMLRQAVSHDDDLEDLCDTLLEKFGQGKQDDIALLAFRRP